MIEPRPYQREALAAVLEAQTKGITRQLISLPTGCGKTIIFGMIAAAQRCRTLILAHREELLYQARDKIRLVYPNADIGILKAEERGGLDAEICIASVQTAARRLPMLKEKGLNLCICDEAHHATAGSYMSVFDELGFMQDNAGKLLIGVTATAYRGDNVPLGDVFQEIVFERSILAMMKAGYLCDVRGLEVKTATSIQNVRTSAGDFAIGELARAIDTPERNALIVETYIRHGEGRRGVAFCADVRHAQHLAKEFEARGVSCEAVYGDMPADERRDILRRYEVKGINILTNCAVLTEGWDCPDTSIIMMARPTQSKGLFVQCVGRGLRLAPGKQDCLLLDFVDTAKTGKLAGFGSLAGDKPLKRKQGATLREAIEEAEREIIAHAPMEAKVEAVDLFSNSRFTWLSVEKHYKLALRDGGSLWCRAKDDGYIPFMMSPDGQTSPLAQEPLPLGYALGVAEDYARKLSAASMARKDAPWRNKPATEAQINALRKMGIEAGAYLTRGKASDLFSQASGQIGATPKQLYFIKKHKLHRSPELLTKYEAGRIIGAYHEKAS